MSLADRILAANDQDRETVHVPEWDVTLELRSPLLKERTKLQALLIDQNATPTADAFEATAISLVAAVAYDPETGEKAFTPEQAALLATKNGRVVERLAIAALRVAGLAPDSLESGKDDSSSTPNGDTGST